MNTAINLTILSVINDRKTAHIKELERVTTDKRVKDNASKASSIFARIDECDQFLSLLTTKLNETAESRLRDLFRDQARLSIESLPPCEFGEINHGGPGELSGSWKQSTTTESIQKETNEGATPVASTFKNPILSD